MLSPGLEAGMRRREFLAVLGGAAAWPTVARGQQAAMPVIGYLSARSPDAEAPLRVPFLKALETSGFVVGHNLAIEYRFANGYDDRLPMLATELLRHRLSLLVAFGRQTAKAARAATATVPIIFASGLDPVLDGLVVSLNRPGGNATGISLFTTELGPKRLTLLRELLPIPGTIAFVVDPNNGTTPFQLKEITAAAQAVGQPLLVVEASSEDQIDKEFGTMAERKVAAVLYGASQFFQVIANHLVELAARYRFPALYEWRDFVAAGGLMSYSTDRTEFARLAGTYAARILKGEKPADLPVMQSTRFELAVNLKTAKALGLDVPTSILLRADEAQQFGRFWGEADIDWQTKPAGSVENDPGCVKTLCCCYDSLVILRGN
jgi:putative tryptophan/tyrosine transport system substrate-binding protein